MTGFANKKTERHFRWAIGKEWTMIFKEINLQKKTRVLVTFEANPNIINQFKEMMIVSPISRKKCY